MEGTPPLNWRGALKLEGTPPVDGGHPSSREGKGMDPLHSLHRLKISKSQDYLTDIGYVHGGVRSPYSGRDTALFAAASDELHGAGSEFYQESGGCLMCTKCLRPYHVENTSSRPITEVKQRRARLVLGWVTAWEYRVP